MRHSRIYLMKRVEELTYQVEAMRKECTNQMEALRKENASLRVQMSDMRADADRMAEETLQRLDAMKKRLTASNRENSYLLKTNLELSKKLNVKPVKTKLNYEIKD